jgi:hypothetical protein
MTGQMLKPLINQICAFVIAMGQTSSDQEAVSGKNRSFATATILLRSLFTFAELYKGQRNMVSSGCRTLNFVIHLSNMLVTFLLMSGKEASLCESSRPTPS